MSVSLKVVYAADKSTSQITEVPNSCTIGILKKRIGKINGQENTDPIRLVQRGRVLQDYETVGSLLVSENTTVVIFATGITKKIRKQRQLPPQELRNQNHINASPWKSPSKILPVLALIGIFAVIAFLSYAQLTPNENVGGKVTKLVNWNKQNIILATSIIGLAGFIIAWLVKLDSKKLVEYGKMFVMTLLPTFDMEAFKREHGIET